MLGGGRKAAGPAPHSADSLALAIAEALAPLANPLRAAAMAAYMRGQFEFLGISTPMRRAATAPLLRQRHSAEVLIGTARVLWKLPQREYQYVAVDLLIRHWKAFSPCHVEDLLALAQQRSWWDTVDGLAGAVGDIVKAGRQIDPDVLRAMDVALRHGDKWVKRIAMLHQLGWRGETDVSRLFGYALELAPESDFFIRKAIGWALRDYARHDPEAVRSFLSRSGKQLSPLSVREAAKHLGNIQAAS